MKTSLVDGYLSKYQEEGDDLEERAEELRERMTRLEEVQEEDKDQAQPGDRGSRTTHDQNYRVKRYKPR